MIDEARLRSVTLGLERAMPNARGDLAWLVGEVRRLVVHLRQLQEAREAEAKIITRGCRALDALAVAEHALAEAVYRMTWDGDFVSSQMGRSRPRELSTAQDALVAIRKVLSAKDITEEPYDPSGQARPSAEGHAHTPSP